MCERWSHSWFSSNSAFFYLQDPYRTVFSDRSSSDFLWTKLPFCPKKGRDTHLSVEHCGHTDGFVTALKYDVILLVCQSAVSPLAFSPTVTHQAITLTNDPQHPLSIATLIRFTKHCAIVLQFLPFLIFQIIYGSPPNIYTLMIYRLNLWEGIWRNCVRMKQAHFGDVIHTLLEAVSWSAWWSSWPSCQTLYICVCV